MSLAKRIARVRRIPAHSKVPFSLEEDVVSGHEILRVKTPIPTNGGITVEWYVHPDFRPHDLGHDSVGSYLGIVLRHSNIPVTHPASTAPRVLESLGFFEREDRPGNYYVFTDEPPALRMCIEDVIRSTGLYRYPISQSDAQLEFYF